MVILDTHAWIWYVTESSKLGSNAVKLINKKDVCGVSAISCWEVAMLVAKRRIEFNIPIEDWIKLALEYNKIRLIHLTPEISIQAAYIEQPFHGDPADRIITATALLTNSILITKDKKIIESTLLKTIW
jgi:PIN domain nuclease of toxin-antitoxin system